MLLLEIGDWFDSRSETFALTDPLVEGVTEAFNSQSAEPFN